MSKSIDIDRVVACLRNIVDINRCGTCDKLEDLRRRTNCGHIVCEHCAAKEVECITCSPGPGSPVNELSLDDTLIKKSENALALLNTFEDTFKTNVYRRSRISEQLKIEKELFPECIQAPAKYCNKRKSFNSLSSTNKENRRTSFYLREAIPTLSNMEKSKYIEQWLNNSTNKINTQRKPFSNINVNDQCFSSIKRNVPLTRLKRLNDENRSKKAKTKANKTKVITRSKISVIESFKHDNNIKEVKSVTSKPVKIDSLLHESNSKVQDESGIFIDDDYIVLDDSQATTIDKDALALQAVIEADKHEYSDYASLLENKDISQVKDYKVPFLYKSSLYKSCSDCSHDIKIIDAGTTKNVSITIVYNEKKEFKQSMSVQTELSEISNVKTDAILDLNIQSNKKVKENAESQSIFLQEEGKYYVNTSKKTSSGLPCLIIDESDSETEPVSLEVMAEVHRSCDADDYGVLSDLSQTELYSRKRGPVRGVTPDSTNSSDKENFDPNRMKRSRCDKKHSKKGKFDYKI